MYITMKVYNVGDVKADMKIAVCCI